MPGGGSPSPGGRAERGRHLILGTAVGLGIFTVSAIVLWVGGWQDIIRSDTTFGDPAITTLTGVVAAPVIEEVVFAT